MERKIFQTKHSPGERILSWFLVFVMIITMSSFSLTGAIVAKAEDKEITLYFKLPDGTSAGDWGFNCWSGVSVAANGAGEEKEIKTWGGNQTKPQLLAAETGWGKVTVNFTQTKGAVQFVKFNDGTEYKCDPWNTGITKLTAAYFNTTDSKWYSDKECNMEITPLSENQITADLTVHYKNENAWDKVGVCFGYTSSWTSIPGLEYCKNGAGAIVQENASNSGWFSFKIHITIAKGEMICGKFNTTTWDNESGQFNIPIDKEQKEVWITSQNVNGTETAPSGWKSGAAVSAPINPADLSVVESPVINDDDSVTFNYEISASKLGGNKLYLMGELTDWDNGKEMTDADGDGIYSVTIPDVKPGKYAYKFKYGNTWVADPLNSEHRGEDSLLVVEGFLINCDNLAGTGKFDVSAEVTDSVKKDTIEWSIGDADNKDTAVGITIKGNSSDPTKAEITTTNAAKNGYYTVVANYTDNKGKNHQAEQKLYYTRKAFLYEYEYKSNSEYKGKSDIYTWSNSLAGNVGVKFRAVDGKNTAYITLDDTTTDFGYIVRRFGEWGDNDREFADRTLTAYADDRYTKVKGGEGKEVPYLLPSGKTYFDGGIVFAWRDDDRFYNNTMYQLSGKTVQVVIQDSTGSNIIKTEKMTYNIEDELFTYKWTGMDDGIYKFYFMVDGAKVEDQYWGGQIEYKKPVLDITTKVTPEEVNYNQNPVVSFTIKDHDTGKDIKVAAITADLSILGYSGQTVAFQPDSKQGVLYIDRSVAAGTYTVPFTITDTYGNKTVKDVEIRVSEKTDSAPSWDESRIYFLLTDRFVDGDTSNNYNVNKAKIESYHGGDFKGLTSKLGYLQELGINTIWITPIVDNIDNVVNVELNQQGYHGYWAKDFTKIDEHLGNTADLDRLIDEAEKRGIKIMVDIVVNHAGYGMENSSRFAGMIRPKKEAVDSDFILQWQGGLPDFKTEEAAVRAKLVAWQTAWANHTTPAGNRIAYFRVDTVKHVEHGTWQDLKTSLASVNPAFKMIGEYYGAGVSNTGEYLGNGQMDALLDFEFKSIARNFVNGSIDSVESTLESRNTKLSGSLTMGQFLGSHDEDGFLYSIGNDTSKMKVAAALQITAKGIPVVYYGEEINLTGPNDFGNQNNNRYDMQFDNLTDDQKAMLNHYKKLLAARAMYSNVFSTGTRTKIAGSDSNGYLVFKRSAGGENVYVGLNTTDTEKQVTFSVSEDGLTNVYSGEDVEVSAKRVTVTIPARSNGGTVILAKGRELTDVSFQGPAKTSYTIGEELNLDGITVTGIYDGTVKVPISTGYAIDASAFDNTKVGTYKITVNYKTYSQEFQVRVSERVLSGGSSSGNVTDGTGVTKNPDGTITITTVETAVNSAGKSIEITTRITKSKDGSVIETEQVTVIAEAAKNTSAVVTVQKDAGGSITKAEAKVTKTGTEAVKGTKATLSAAVTAQIKEAAGTEAVMITTSVTDSSGAEKYTVAVDSKDFAVGESLEVLAIDNTTGEYILVNVKACKVNKKGNVTFTLLDGKNYVLLNSRDAKKISDAILKTVKVKKSSKTLKVGKKTTIRLSNKLNMDNVMKITYTTDNKKKATVNKNGKITAKKKGTVVIRAKVTLNNRKTKTVTMKVKIR